MSKITYANKSNASISGLPANQKVSDTDMNQIKTVVNANDDTLITTNDDLADLTAISGSVPFSFKFDNSTLPTSPSSGYFRIDTVTLASATDIFINAVDVATIDNTDVLLEMVAGSFIYIQYRQGEKMAGLYEVVTVTNNTGWFTFGVTPLDGTAAIPPLDSLCAMAFIPKATGGSGDVATDAIWDAKGDMVAATGNNAATKVTVGANGKILSANSAISNGVEWTDFVDEIGIEIGALDTDLTTGTRKGTYVMPFNATLLDVQSSVDNTTAARPTGSTLVSDINLNGSTVLSTKLSIDAGEYRSRDAAVPPVISTSAFNEGDEVTFDTDQVGSTNAGQNLVIFLKFTRPV